MSEWHRKEHFLIAQTSIWNETALPDGEEEIKP
jgi:hypothetical protein